MVKLAVEGTPRFLASDGRPRDCVSVIEAAYDLSGEDDAWLAGVLQATEPVLGRGLGMFGMFYSLDRGGTPLALRAPVLVGCRPGFFDAMVASSWLASPEDMRSMFGGAMCKSLSQAITTTGQDYEAHEGSRLMLERTGVADVLIVQVADTQEWGISVAAYTPTVARFPPRTAGLMSRLTRHIAAGYRLRRSLRQSQAETIPGEPDAVLSPRGAVLHADGDAKSAAARKLLTTAAERIHHARTRTRPTDPEEAVRLWRTLVDGRWSLVDATDVDGKRLVVARRNAPDVRDPAALAPQERTVIALFALGHSAKLVAYELGISPSTVSTRLQNGLRKLGLRSVAELSSVAGSKGTSATRPGRPRGGSRQHE